MQSYLNNALQHVSVWESFGVQPNQGEVYGSTLLQGYESRPLREGEFHARVRKSGHALATEITYVAAPVIRGDDTEPSIDLCPMVLPSSMVTCLDRLPELLKSYLNP